MSIISVQNIMSVSTLNFSGDPNLGLYSFATDEICLIPPLKKWVENEIKKSLDVKTVKTSLAGTNILGIFAAGNSNGLLLPEIARKQELENLKKHTEVLVLKGKYTALGNLILANDKGCIISEKIKKYKPDIEDFLHVKVTVHEIADLEIVGSLALATNKGCLVSKIATKKDLEIIEKVLEVKAGFATVNFGSIFVKSGLLANSKGALIGDHTTGPEIQNITEMLGFI